MASRSKRRAVAMTAGIVGALLPFRPLLFTKLGDPTAETIDLFLSPAFLLAGLLPPMGDLELVVFGAIVLTNAILYWFVARLLWKWVTSEF